MRAELTVPAASPAAHADAAVTPADKITLSETDRSRLHVRIHTGHTSARARRASSDRSIC